MGIISHAAAAGLGYALARPEGRRQLIKLRDQARQLLQHPRVTQLQERGQQLAAQQASAAVEAVKEKLGHSSDPQETPTPWAADDTRNRTPSGPRHAADVNPTSPGPADGARSFEANFEQDPGAAPIVLPPAQPGTTPPA